MSNNSSSGLDDRRRAHRRALRAAKVVTLAFALGGCYGAHERVPPPPPAPDSGPLMADAGSFDAGPGTDAGPGIDAGPPMVDAGPADAGPIADCEPDPDCAFGGGDGCDWDQWNACCEEHDWNIEPCWLPGGPMRPPEMPA